MGVEVVVDGLSKSFGKQTIWRTSRLTLPPGEISVLLGPSGTGKSVFLKSWSGAQTRTRPDRHHRHDIVRCSDTGSTTSQAVGVLFQDGALFGSMDLFDTSLPLREHTKR